MNERSAVQVHEDGGSDPSPGAPLSWTELRHPEQLGPWRAAINDLVDRRRLPELASGDWWSAFWEAFFPDDPRVRLQVLHRSGRVVAVLPMQRQGRIVRRMVGLQNEHAPMWAVPVDDSDDQLGSAMLDRLTEGVDCLELRRLPLDGPLAGALKAAAAARGFPVVELPSEGGEVGLSLQGPWSSFEKTLSRNLRRDGRQLAKLQAIGQVEFEVVEGGPRLACELTACFELEVRGWKGKRGTAVLADTRALRFYRWLAERAGARGRFVLYLLKLDGRIIAFEYDLRGGARIECLKIGYDEALSRHSPGTVLRMMVLRRTIERNEASEYRLGRASEWKRRWVTSQARIGTLRVFARSRRGRLSYLTGPVMRGSVKRLPGVRPAIGYARKVLELVRDRLRGRLAEGARTASDSNQPLEEAE